MLFSSHRKGSTLGSIKETISLNWPVDMRLYDKKIKRYLVNALATGEVIQPENKKKAQAKGFRGRFTVPGMKAKKTKKRKKAKKESEDEVNRSMTALMKLRLVMVPYFSRAGTRTSSTSLPRRLGTRSARSTRRSWRGGGRRERCGRRRRPSRR